MAMAGVRKTHFLLYLIVVLVGFTCYQSFMLTQSLNKRLMLEQQSMIWMAMEPPLHALNRTRVILEATKDFVTEVTRDLKHSVLPYTKQQVLSQMTDEMMY